jgi:phospholipase/lecithinase/hemolysin
MKPVEKVAVVACILSAIFCVPARADFAKLYVFGDSLSDDGNVFALTGGLFPPSPYDQHFSNGPVAVDQLAAILGIDLTASATGGTNYAVGGATTGTANYLPTEYPQLGLGPALNNTGMQTQVNTFTHAAPVFDPASTLFVVWGGPNDFFLSATPEAAAQAVNNLAGEIVALEGVGARNFLVPNMPDLSITPYGRSLTLEQQAGLQQLSLGFDAGLGQALAGLRAAAPTGVDIVGFDTLSALNALVFNPSAYGLSNVTDPCFNLAATSVCADPDEYLFWDTVHPTAHVHDILGGEFAAAVPEPQTWYLMALGLLVVAVRTLLRNTRQMSIVNA